MKKILIIGASSGIGKTLSQALAEEHHDVFGTYFKTEVNSTDIHFQYLDVTANTIDLDNLPEVLDGVVYCPGSINLLPFHRFKAEDFVKDYQLQVVGAVKVIQAILPNLKKSEQSSIVLFSTVAVQSGYTFHSQVAASKGAIEGLTRSLAAELAPKIRVNAIAPSLTQTPLAGKLLNTDQKIESNANRHPLKRIGQTEDIAQMASFLLSEKSSWVTGQILHVDGGMSSIKS
jgi:NAD(P)-dependent dehydrogenase (short-subunit alcohol dehydrogenase family)